MTEAIKKALTAYVTNCSKHHFIFVCKKKATPTGLEYVVNRLYELMEANPSWSKSQCLAQIEVQLNDENYY